ncbi:hypothetical protein L210DRAFT_3508914 [Boletus edulis BED1]|uniref:Uncharacterized protein n=1 Tax=Boletus edulis BED1 TaxID=1328754 RepID=A0AAD4G8E5_BOLED|nr:hypothetical protein L210DRAFT_3508914 [Boletus edulis BED1]
MSSDLQSLLESVVLNNYITRTTAHKSVDVVIITAVVYDYVLTFSREVFHLLYTSVSRLTIYKDRCKPWTRVSAMFVVVRTSLSIRYIGLCWVLASALTGSTFFPGPLEVSFPPLYTPYPLVMVQFQQICTVVYLLVVMILRVYALWNRSKAILYILLFLYVVQTIVVIVYNGIYSNPNTHLSVLSQFILAVTLFIFAVFQTVKQSVELYKATKQWQPNRYVQQLVSDGIIYFALNVLYQILDYVVFNDIGVPTTNASLILVASGYILYCTLVPRFTIGIRELYDRDISGRFHIDTGFGVLSQLNVDLDTTVSAVVFGVNQGLGVEGDIEMGDRVHESGLNENTPTGGSGV